MQLQDLVKPLDQLTDDELMARLRVNRANRTTIRPAAKSRAKKAAKKGSQARVSKIEALLNDMTEEQKQQLILELGEG